MAIPIKIPCKKYIRDFLALYFESKNVTFDEGSEEYIFMRNLVSKKPIGGKESKDPFFDCFITLMIGNWNENQKVVYVSNKNAYKFFFRYQRLFADYFIQWVNSKRTGEGFKIETTIRAFALSFNWTEEEMKHETLLKLYQRKGGLKGKKATDILRWTPPTVHLTVLF